MKKKLLSLALALALCMGLMAVPALAAEPFTYDSGGIRVTNVLDSQKSDAHGGSAYTCVAPASVAPGTGSILESSWARAHKFPEGAGLSVDNYLEHLTELVEDDAAWFKTGDGKSVVLTEPGCYLVWLTVEFEESCGEGFILVNLQASTEPGTDDPAANTGFTDVKSGDWFYEPVQWAVKEGVTNGTSLTTFSPNQDCTVAHILTFLWRANGSPKAEGDNPFSDVKADDWFYGAALWAQEQGMVTGDTFGPDTPCTRSMAVKYLWQAAGSPSAKASNFSDVPAGADYAQAVNWAVEKGITNGTSLTSFSPSEVCTRGHIVTFLYRDLAK